jgi:NAD(P)-dependent dehydrogenase (short-subunit alcohol dehydrogenase family)
LPTTRPQRQLSSNFTKTGLTDIQDIVPWIRFLVSDGWWMTGQTILVNGGYTTK